MTERRLRLSAALLAAWILGAGCGGDQDDIAGPIPGTLVVSLSTPNADDGAIVIRVGGPGGITGVTAQDPGLYLHWVQTGNTVTVVLVGDLAGGGILEVSVPDVGDVGSYYGSVLEVADRSSALRASLEGYALTIARGG